MLARNLRSGHETNAGRGPVARDGAGDLDREVSHDAPAGEINLAFLLKSRSRTAPTPVLLRVTVADHAGRAILSSTIEGTTLLHARLAQGTYTVIVRSGDAIRVRDCEVSPGRTERVLFEWDA